MTRPNALSAAVQGQSGQGSNVILYLPPGPLFQDLDNPSSPPAKSNPKSQSSLFEHVLASTTSATVVTVNYRLGSTTNTPDDSISNKTSTPSQLQASQAFQKQPDSYKYPTPIHDTLVGFDWIQNTLNPAKVGVFGSHIGGSLAIMLALTEAQSVHAVSAMEPVCDWPGLDEYCAIEEESAPGTEQDNTTLNDTERKPLTRQPKRKASRTLLPRDLIPLLTARERFFTSPERYFDAFASPVLFLRSAGRNVPKTFPQYLTGPEYPVPTMRIPRKTTSAEQYSASDGSLWDRDIYPDLDDEIGDDQMESSTSPVRRRKALSRWPPYGLDYDLNSSGSGRIWSGPNSGIARLELTLPWVRVWLSRAGLPMDGEPPSETSHKDTHHDATVLARQGEEMVSVMRRACFWGREKGFGERRVTLSRVGLNFDEEVGTWFNSVFDGSMDED